MALTKIQTFIKKWSTSPQVKKVVADIQTISEDLQKRAQHLNKEDAIKKYKEIMKKVSKTEANLEKEMNKVMSKVKQSASQVEKNLNQYKKKAVAQKENIEKVFGAKAKSVSSTAKKTAKKTTTKKKSAKKVVRKAAAKK